MKHEPVDFFTAFLSVCLGITSVVVGVLVVKLILAL